jgi:hypothetical protein
MLAKRRCDLARVTALESYRSRSPIAIKRISVQPNAAPALLPQAWHINSAAGSFCEMIGVVIYRESRHHLRAPRSDWCGVVHNFRLCDRVGLSLCDWRGTYPAMYSNRSEALQMRDR